VKIGGGNDARVTPGRFSTLSDINTIITTMKRGSPLDYGFVAVACSISLLCVAPYLLKKAELLC
jgi:hypothetical protein